MKLFRYILPAFVAFTLVSCSDEVYAPDCPVSEDNESLKINISFDIPEFASARSRAFTDMPDYEGLELHVLEFEYGDDPINNVMTNNYNLQEGALSEVTVSNDIDSDGDVHFTLKLNATDQPRVLHFIAVPNGTELNIGSQNEGILIPSLTVSNQTPAYWQRVVFDHGYGTFDNSDNFTKSTDLETKLEHIPMLRNFAKITLGPGNDVSSQQIEGFAIVNQPNIGSVAPWNRTQAKFPDFFVNSYNSKLDYQKITDTCYTGYWNFSPVNDIGNKTAPGADSESYNGDPKFIYEIPHSTLNSPLIIMKARPAITDPWSYYKIDLGKKIEEGANQGGFVFYNILRNFSYNITVNSIDATGYDTPAEALSGVVFNNFSFDVNTMQMQNISDGANMLWVNNTTFVVTNDSEREVKILFRFRTGINTGTGAGTDASGRLEIRDLATGEAIQSVPANLNVNDLPTDGEWKVLTITTEAPSDETKRQEFVIIDPETGIGRTIRIIVRNPWDYRTPTLYGVNYDTYDQYQTTVNKYSQWANRVSTNNWSYENQQPLTVGFFIDNDIPEAMFPLQFVYEANPQVIENNKDGNLFVNTGSSLFNSDNIAIKYVKTVTWADFNTELKDSSTGVKVMNGTQELHFVRARFLTTSSLTTNTTYTVRVYNPYFISNSTDPKYLNVTFTPSGLNLNGPDLSTAN